MKKYLYNFMVWMLARSLLWLPFTAAFYFDNLYLLLLYIPLISAVMVTKP